MYLCAYHAEEYETQSKAEKVIAALTTRSLEEPCLYSTWRHSVHTAAGWSGPMRVCMDCGAKSTNMKQAIDLVRFVGQHSGFTLEQLLGYSRRDPQLSAARQLAMWLCRDKLQLSYPAIGELLQRNHTTVMHACYPYYAASFAGATACGEAEHVWRSYLASELGSSGSRELDLGAP